MTGLKTTADNNLIDQASSNAIAWRQIYLCISLFALLMCRSLIFQFIYDVPDIQDDAFYYSIIARNIVETGLSTFDGISLTNGYHPLWMAVLVIWFSLFNDSILLVKLLEAFILSMSLFFLLKLVNSRNLLFDIIIGGSFYYATLLASYIGMETTILYLVYTLTVWVLLSDRPFIRNRRGIISGFAGALCIAARIDAAVFIIPMVLFALPSRRERLESLSILGVLGASYAVASYAIFGVALPISGEIKSLGGFGINEKLLRNFMYWLSPKSALIGNYLTVALAYAVASLMILSSAVGDRTKRIIIALGVGFILYNIKLFLFSSWRIWDWYRFPIYLIVVPGLLAFQDIHRQLVQRGRNPFGGIDRLSLPNVALILIAIPLGFIYPIFGTLLYSRTNLAFNFADLNRTVATIYSNVLDKSLVGMGDRSGSFAYYYDGPVFQLEGLVSSKDYLEVLRASGDVTAYLCRHNVKFVVDYEVDLGDYTHHDVEILRPYLTSYNGPTIRLTKEAEVGRYVNLNLYDNTGTGQDDNYVYIWRLTCDDQNYSGSSTHASGS